MKSAFVLHFSWIFLAYGAKSLEKDYFVSTKGSDAWDGTSFENSPGANKGPWLTISHAIQKLRVIRPDNPGPQDRTRLNLMSGTYYQTTNLWLDHRESYLDIVAYKGDEVSISGGILLDVPWQRQGNVLSARFPGSCSEAFYGSQRLLSARSPNMEWGWNKNTAQAPYHVIKDLLVETDSCHRDSHHFSQSCPDEDRNGFVFTDEISEEWEFLNQTYILVFHSWIAEYAKIANVTKKNGNKIVMFQEPLEHAAVGTWNLPSGWRFLIYNNLALLDIPGEYVCIEENEQVQFSYIPPDYENEKPILSKLKTILILNNARHVNIEGIRFQHSASDGVGDAVKLLNVEDVSIQDCQFSHTGSSGLFISNSSRVAVQNNVFFDIGYHGIVTNFQNVNDSMDDILIKNNLFDGCGSSNLWAPGCLSIAGRYNISVINNEMTNTPYQGMSIYGLMPHGANYWPDNDVTDPKKDDYIFHIEFNYIHDYGNGILSDFGAVHTGSGCDEFESEEELGKYCYTYIHLYNNLMHGSRGFYDSRGSFLYSDTSSCRNTFENNIIYGDGGMPMIHHCGLDNISKNNIIHRTSGDHPPRFMWGGCEKNRAQLQRFTNSHNIYFLNNADDLHFGKSSNRYYNEAPDFHHNLYWSQKMGDENLPMFPDDLTWEEWVLAGNDSASLWADPLFVDPESGQYLLADNSPAWDMGIQQIRLDNFGLQHKMKYYIKN